VLDFAERAATKLHTLIKNSALDIPVQYSRGRSKLFMS